MARTTVAFIQRGLAFAHAALRDARNGTDDQLHFVPPSGSHSIAWCLWHTARIEDLIINRLVQGGPVLWDPAWAERIGLPFEGFGTGMSDADAQQIRIRDMDAFAAYQEAVWAATEKFLDEVDDEALDRELPSRTGTET
ncbi:MAG: DinB family protein, partial [Dehalococcoidia bacterium]